MFNVGDIVTCSDSFCARHKWTETEEWEGLVVSTDPWNRELKTQVPVLWTRLNPPDIGGPHYCSYTPENLKLKYAYPVKSLEDYM
jgi:hypothetical protein